MSEPTANLPAAKPKSLIRADESGALRPQDHEELYRLAAQMAGSSLLPESLRNKPADVFMVFQMGAELGLSMIQSVKSIHVIKGTPALSAESMGALVLASGLCEDQTVWITGEGKTLTAHVKVKRKGMNSPQESSFSMAEAVTAGVASNPNYAKYPGDMLTARAKARAYRILFPDVVKGMSAVEEAQDFAPRGAAPALAGRPQAQTGQPAAQEAPSPALRRRVVAEDAAPVEVAQEAFVGETATAQTDDALFAQARELDNA